MAGETVITVVGNVVEDQPELRYTTAGKAVAKFRVASTPRTFDRESNAWKDGDSLFLTCSVWGQMGENAASTLQRGMRVIVQGRLKQRSYEDREGVKRTVYELDVEEIGVSLRSATAKVTKGSSGGGQGRQQYEQARQASSREGREDPWASGVPGTQAAGGWGGGDEPPPF
ncbi:single-stranded DNA-binding protein [Streptomyces rochei]|uniref:single-stranded DNA-binding protein n=1 Tax=Streptomyces rochei TaxID=1928 RepID=UPI003415D1BD